MSDRQSTEELLSFPCLYEFKVFGPADGHDDFSETVRQAVSAVVPVTSESLKVRLSRAGRYQCVSILVHLKNGAQLTDIYGILRGIPELRYLL